MKKISKLAPVLLAGALLFSGCAENPADNVPAAVINIGNILGSFVEIKKVN